MQKTGFSFQHIAADQTFQALSGSLFSVIQVFDVQVSQATLVSATGSGTMLLDSIQRRGQHGKPETLNP